jgi:hypothetical protein
MARTIAATERRPAYEPLYDIDPHSGASIEIFYCDSMLARSFATREGWFWWTCQPGLLPNVPPVGPFGSSYLAFCDAMR